MHGLARGSSGKGAGPRSLPGWSWERVGPGHLGRKRWTLALSIGQPVAGGPGHAEPASCVPVSSSSEPGRAGESAGRGPPVFVPGSAMAAASLVKAGMQGLLPPVAGRHAPVDQPGQIGSHRREAPASLLSPVRCSHGRGGNEYRRSSTGGFVVARAQMSLSGHATCWIMTLAPPAPAGDAFRRASSTLSSQITRGNSLRRTSRADLGPAPPPIPARTGIQAVPCAHPLGRAQQMAEWSPVPGKGRKPWYRGEDADQRAQLAHPR